MKERIAKIAAFIMLLAVTAEAVWLVALNDGYWALWKIRWQKVVSQSRSEARQHAPAPVLTANYPRFALMATASLPDSLGTYDVLIMPPTTNGDVISAIRAFRAAHPSGLVLARVDPVSFDDRDGAVLGKLDKALAPLLEPYHFYTRYGRRVRLDDGTAALNLTAPLYPDSSGGTIAKAMADLYAKNLFNNTIWDGLFITGLSAAPPFHERGIDATGDGKADDVQTVDSAWRQGWRDFLDSLRLAAGSNLVVVGQGAGVDTYAAMLNGEVITYPAERTFSAWAGFMRAYLDDVKNAIKPALMLVNTPANAGENVGRNERVSALLGDGFSLLRAPSEDAGRAPVRYDEDTVNLGPAKAPAYRVGEPSSAHKPTSLLTNLAPGLYRRDFANGSVLFNASGQPLSYTFTKPFVAISGGREPEVNNGLPATTVALPPYQGRVFVRPALSAASSPFSSRVKPAFLSAVTTPVSPPVSALSEKSSAGQAAPAASSEPSDPASLTPAARVRAKAAPRTAVLFLKTPISEAEAAALAGWDIVILGLQTQSVSPNAFSIIRAHNPSAVILAYTLPGVVPKGNLAEIEPDGGIWHTLVGDLSDDNYIKDTTGHTIDIWPGMPILNLNTKVGALPLPKFLAHFWHDQVLKTGLWDGLFFDNAEERISHVATDGVLSGTSAASSAAIDSMWHNGLNEQFKDLRSLTGGQYLVVGNGQGALSYGNVFDGFMLESFPNAAQGSWAQNMNTLASMASRSGALHLIIVHSDTANTGIKNPTFVRFTLASALLVDAWYAYDFGSNDHSQLWRFPEYDLKLGSPKGPAYPLGGGTLSRWQMEPYERDFANGAVVINPTNLAITATLRGKRVTIKPHDAFIGR